MVVLSDAEVGKSAAQVLKRKSKDFIKPKGFFIFKISRCAKGTVSKLFVCNF